MIVIAGPELPRDALPVTVAITMETPRLHTLQRSEIGGAPKYPVANLTASQVPTAPGVYAWYRDGACMDIGKASSLPRPSTILRQVEREISWLCAVALLPPRHILVILDACHSGIALDPIVRWRSDVTRGLPPDGMAALIARRSRRIITSARRRGRS